MLSKALADPSRLNLTAQKLAGKLLVSPWCWPTDEATAKRASLLLSVALPDATRAGPRPGDALLVSINQSKAAALWRLSFQPTGETTAIDDTTRRAIRNARHLALEHIPLLFDLRAYMTLEWSAERIYPAVDVVDDKILTDTSYGLSAVLAHVSYLLDIPVPTTIACSAVVQSDGRLTEVGGLDKKVELLANTALGVTTVLVSDKQPDTDVFKPFPRLNCVLVKTVADAIEKVFGNLARNLGETWRTDRNAAIEALAGLEQLVRVERADVPWPSVVFAAERIVAACDQSEYHHAAATKAFRMARDRANAANQTPTTKPFRGLDPFEEADRHTFFGRDDAIDEVVTALEKHSLVTIFGDSGCGKTSLLHAGVLPRLKAEGRYVAEPLRPGRAPLARLEALFPQTGNAAEDLIVRIDKLAPIVIIDQAEELFTLSNDCERIEIAQTLARLAAGRTRIVLAIRTDFFGQLWRLPHLGELYRDDVDRDRAYLLPLGIPDGAALAMALTKPAKALKVTFEPELVERIVDEVENERGALPLLQCCGRLLWDSHSGTEITRVDYAAIGGVKGAVKRHADAVLAEMPAEQRAIAWKLLRPLITPQRTRAVVPELELRGYVGDAGQATSMLEHLVKGRLLNRFDDLAEVAQIELIHDTLIEHSEIAEWLQDQDRAFCIVLDRSAMRWTSESERPGLLLKDKDELARAVALVRTRSKWFGATTTLYIQRSRSHARRVRLAASLFGAAVVVAFLLVVLVFSARTARQRDRAEVARADAQRTYAATLEAQGRELMGAQQPRRAAVVLASAYAAAPPRTSLRLALGEAMRAVEVPSFALGAGPGMMWHAHLARNGSLAVTIHDGVADVWSVDGRLLRTIASSTGDKLQDAALDPAARRIAVVDAKGNAAIHDVATGANIEDHKTGISPMFDEGRIILHTIEFTSDGEGVYVRHIGYPKGGGKEEISIAEAWARDSETPHVWPASIGGRLALDWSVGLVVRDVLTRRVLYAPHGQGAWFSSDGNTLIVETVDGVDLLRASDGTRLGRIAPDELRTKESWDDVDATVGCTVIDVLLRHEATGDKPRRTLLHCTNGRWIVGDEAGHALGWYQAADVFLIASPRPLIVVNHQTAVSVIDADTAAPIVVLDSTPSDLGRGRPESDGTHLLTHGAVSARLWTLPSLPTIQLPMHPPFRELFVTDDGERIVALTSGGDLEVVSTASHAVVYREHVGDPAQDQLVHLGETATITTNADHRGAVVYHPFGGPDVTLGRTDKPVRSISTKTRHVILGGARGAVWLGTLGEGTLRRVGTLTADVSNTQLSLDETRAAIVTLDGAVAVLDTASGTEVCRAHIDGAGGVLVAYSPDGDRLAVARSRTILIVNAATCAMVRKLDGHTSSVSSIAFAPDGLQLASKSIQEKRARLWNVATGESREFGSWDGSAALTYSHDGHLLSVGNIVVDTETLAPVPRLEGSMFGFDARDQYEVLAFPSSVALRPLRREARPPEVIDAILRANLPWRMVDGKLQEPIADPSILGAQAPTPDAASAK